MTTRPRRTPPDRNQAAEHAKLRKRGCLCIPVHNLPGDPKANPLDAFVFSRPRRHLVQVEWKSRSGASFTENEQEYFKALGIWDLLQLWLEPVAPWHQTGIPVVVTWRAEQLMELFAAMEERALAIRGFRLLASAQSDYTGIAAKQGT